MSHIWAEHVPTRYLNLLGDVTMPGCRERCCSDSYGIEYRLALTRLEWQLSGWDLVPILSIVVLCLLIIDTALLAVEGWLW